MILTYLKLLTKKKIFLKERSKHNMSKRYKITNGKWLRTSCSMSHPYYYMRTGCKIKRALNQGFEVYEEL